MSDPIESLPRLRPGSPIAEAAAHYRKSLQSARRPKNTIDSYLYDLTILAVKIPTKSVNQVTAADISRFLGDANTSSTRKRRLTSLRRFFKFLIEEARVLSFDPTADVVPNRIELKEPRILTSDEQASVLRSAASDESWSLPAILLMMQVGLNRSEILTLSRGDIDRLNPDVYLVSVVSEELSKPARNRTLRAIAPFPESYERFLADRNPDGLLFPVGFQAINGMVQRVRKSAGIDRSITPRTLRETFIANRYLAGASEDELIAELGLASDLRNRQSVRRFRPKRDQADESSEMS